MNTVHNDYLETSGSYLVGKIETSAHQITKIFGEPTEFEDSKVNREWKIKFDDALQTVATIYDWKMEKPGYFDICTYNIGGFGPKAAELVTNALKPQIRKSLFIKGREWFDKINGNSYFSARIYVDGDLVITLPFQYGYGDQYLYVAQMELLSAGYLPQEVKNIGLWTIAKELGFDFYSVKSSTNKNQMFKL